MRWHSCPAELYPLHPSTMFAENPTVWQMCISYATSCSPPCIVLVNNSHSPFRALLPFLSTFDGAQTTAMELFPSGPGCLWVVLAAPWWLNGRGPCCPPSACCCGRGILWQEMIVTVCHFSRGRVDCAGHSRTKAMLSCRENNNVSAGQREYKNIKSY